jgi:membrane protease YdiL (CAAX protease family)
LAIVVVIPVSEEILFRGLLFSALQKWWRMRWVIVVTAFVFALIHVDLVFFPALFFLGLILGWARVKSRSLGLPILIHVTNNLIAMGVVAIFGLR